MEDAELDQHERLLLSEFHSCDENGVGSLDRSQLSQLCEQLELKDRGTGLINLLIGETDSRVTFREFRNGLVTLLGQDDYKMSGEDSPGMDLSLVESSGVEPNEGEFSGVEPSGVDLSEVEPSELEPAGMGPSGAEEQELEREISPKYVYGKKKYGRRSRPKSDDPNLDEGDSDSEQPSSSASVNIPKGGMLTRRRFAVNAQLPKKRRTALSDNGQVCSTAIEVTESLPQAQVGRATPLQEPKWVKADLEVQCLWDAWASLGVGSNGFLDKSDLATLCAHIGMEKETEQVVHVIFDNLNVDENNRISFEVFLRLYRTARQSYGSPSKPGVRTGMPQFQDCVDSGVEAGPSSSSNKDDFAWQPVEDNFDGTVSVASILKVWEEAGISDGVVLLHGLGFDEGKVVLSSLFEALEIQMNMLVNDTICPMTTRETLLAATYTLSQLESGTIKAALDQAHKERDKLRLDIVEANDRASLLAQEVDDNHSRLDKAHKDRLLLMERRHNESVKQQTRQLAHERDTLAVHNQTLETRIKELNRVEMHSRSELIVLKEECALLCTENRAANEQLARMETVCASARQEVAALDGLRQGIHEQQVDAEHHEVNALLGKMQTLQAENTVLRDTVDELTIKVESLTSEIAAVTLKKGSQNNEKEDRDKGCVDVASSLKEDLGVAGSSHKRRGVPSIPTVSASSDSSDEDSASRLEKVRRCSITQETAGMSGMQIRTLTPSGSLVDLVVCSPTESVLSGSPSGGGGVTSYYASSDTDHSPGNFTETVLRKEIKRLKKRNKILAEKVANRNEMILENAESFSHLPLKHLHD